MRRIYCYRCVQGKTVDSTYLVYCVAMFVVVLEVKKLAEKLFQGYRKSFSSSHLNLLRYCSCDEGKWGRLTYTRLTMKFEKLRYEGAFWGRFGGDFRREMGNFWG